MLQLKNIKKRYDVAGNIVMALDDVSLCFRKNEFVAILGPSGCGKTTMLNILGGLDRYTSGDLIINGTSTKLFKDRDWDVYRNHRVGFVFQSYNLIPHQTILGNVELALTIAGMSKAERVEKAKKALDKVGLQGQYYKRPNQLSGGQMQRVAIARALVNDPEIILADEPTGALDTKTSVQIMDLLKEVASDRLVIMVTHNPELADAYATRIIGLKDGKVMQDSSPFAVEDEEKEVEKLRQENEEKENEYLAKVESEGGNVRKAKKKRKEKAKMSIWTAFMLSARNLISKRARTIMVGIAGSIGIVGIALVLAFSAGIKMYIASMQDDMLSGNPITVTEQTYDLNALTGMMNTAQKTEIIKEPNKVYVDSMIDYFISMGKLSDSMLIKNNITQDYIDYVNAMPDDYYAAVKYDYGMNLHNNVYTNATLSSENGNISKNLSVTAIVSMYTEILKKTSFEEYASYVNMFIPSMTQAPNSKEYIEHQYDVYGKVATEKDEIMLVISKQSEVSDLLLAMLGYYTQEEFENLVCKADCDCENEIHDADCKYDSSLDKEYFEFDEILDENKSFYWYPNSKLFVKSGFSYTYNHISSEDWNSDENAVKLKVVGILQPKENITYGSLTSGVYYTEALTNHILQTHKNEQGGIVDTIKAIDENTGISSLYMYSGLLASQGQGVSYNLEYFYEGETHTQKQIVSLSSSGGSLIGMMMGGTTSNADIKNGIIRTLGGNDIANSITIYPVSFDNKDLVTDYLKAWNGEEDIIIGEKTLTKDQRDDIEFTDTLSLVIGLVNTMIDIVSYALIAFTSVSLVVSTVMIGIITYVSVVERIKEIGVIRSLGGRKKDVSRLFTAETAIIGLLAGLIGIAATCGIAGIINAILYPLIGIKSLAFLPVMDAIELVLLSIGLTLISGVFPAKAAANKDPVIALRTE